MNFSPALDMSWGPALALWGILMFPFVVGWTLLSESVALRLIRYQRSFWRCLGDATIINLVSGVIGIIWQFFFFDMTKYFFWVNGLVGSPPIDTYQTLSERTETLGILLLLLTGWIGSILLESFVMLALRIWRGDFTGGAEPVDKQKYWREFLDQTLLNSAIINTISYGGMVLALLIF